MAPPPRVESSRIEGGHRHGNQHNEEPPPRFPAEAHGPDDGEGRQDPPEDLPGLFGAAGAGIVLCGVEGQFGPRRVHTPQPTFTGEY